MLQNRSAPQLGLITGIAEHHVGPPSRGQSVTYFFEPPFTGRITDVLRSCNCAKTSQSSRSCRHQEPIRPPRNCSSPHSNICQHLPSEGPANQFRRPSQQRPSTLLEPELGCPSQQRPSTLLKPDCSGSAKHITYPITPLSTLPQSRPHGSTLRPASSSHHP